MSVGIIDQSCMITFELVKCWPTDSAPAPPEQQHNSGTTCRGATVQYIAQRWPEQQIFPHVWPNLCRSPAPFDVLASLALPRAVVVPNAGAGGHGCPLDPLPG